MCKKGALILCDQFIVRMRSEDKEGSDQTQLEEGAQWEESNKQGWVCGDDLGQFLGNQTAKQAVKSLHMYGRDQKVIKAVGLREERAF